MYIYINLIESFNGIISIKVELNFATNKAMLTHKWMHYYNKWASVHNMPLDAVSITWQSGRGSLVCIELVDISCDVSFVSGQFCSIVVEMAWESFTVLPISISAMSELGLPLSGAFLLLISIDLFWEIEFKKY